MAKLNKLIQPRRPDSACPTPDDELHYLYRSKKAALVSDPGFGYMFPRLFTTAEDRAMFFRNAPRKHIECRFPLAQDQRDWIAQHLPEMAEAAAACPQEKENS
jgi:hypothetical protein